MFQYSRIICFLAVMEKVQQRLYGKGTGIIYIYVEHLPEINLSYEKQQTWLDKDYRDAIITRAYLDEHLSELTKLPISLRCANG